MKAHTGAALCSVEVTDGPSTRGPPPDPPSEGVGSLAMQPSPVSQPSKTWLFERLSMEVGVDPGLNLVSCRHLNSVSYLILGMGLKHTHRLCVLLVRLFPILNPAHEECRRYPATLAAYRNMQHRQCHPSAPLVRGAEEENRVQQM